jgi:hypothetical protein
MIEDQYMLAMTKSRIFQHPITRSITTSLSVKQKNTVHLKVLSEYQYPKKNQIIKLTD